MQDGVVLVTMIVMAGLTLVVIWRKGFLSPDALAEAPERRHGLVAEDLLVGIAVLALSQLLAMGVLHLMGYQPFASDPTPLEVGPIDRASQLMVLQLVGTLPVVLFTLIESMRRTQNRLRGIGLTRLNVKRHTFVGLAGFIAAIWICFGVGAVVSLIVEAFDREVPEVAHDVLTEMLNSDSVVAVAMIAVSAIIIAPVLEEVIYRGLVQSGLMAMIGAKRRWTVVLLGAAIFALVHAAVADPLALPTLFVLGVILGWMYERTGSLWPGIIVHAGFNAVNIGVVLMVMKEAMTVS